MDASVREIRTLTRERKLLVGDHLPTVREASRTLTAFGLIEARPKVGAVIIDRPLETALGLFACNREVSPAAFSDVQAFRRLIEVGIGEQMIMEAAEPGLPRAGEINTAMRDA